MNDDTERFRQQIRRAVDALREIADWSVGETGEEGRYVDAIRDVARRALGDISPGVIPGGEEKEGAHLVIIDGREYTVQGDQVTGAQIRELAGILKTHQVWMEMPGREDDEIVGDKTVVKLGLPSAFYSFPRWVNG